MTAVSGRGMGAPPATVSWLLTIVSGLVVLLGASTWTQQPFPLTPLVALALAVTPALVSFDARSAPWWLPVLAPTALLVALPDPTPMLAAWALVVLASHLVWSPGRDAFPRAGLSVGYGALVALAASYTGLGAAVELSYRNQVGASLGADHVLPAVLLVLLAVAAQRAGAASERGRTLEVLSQAASEQPWPDVDTQLQEAAARALPNAGARISAEPGTGARLSAQLADGRYLVLDRARWNRPFTRRDVAATAALVVMADSSRTTARRRVRSESHLSVDPLTGLPNKVGFDDLLEETARQRRPAEQVALLYLDLNGLGEVNSQLGHLDGDEVLRVMGSRLHCELPAGAAAARVVDDEFAILVRHADAAQVATARERLTELVGEPLTVGSQLLQMDVTIGAALSADPDDDLNALLDEARDEVLAAKQSRAGNHRASPRWVNERAFVQGLLGRHRIEVAYQPIIDLPRGRLVGYQALLHTADEDFGTLPQMMLVGAAERLSLLDDLADAMATQAIPTMTKVAEETTLPITLALDVEFAQLDPGNEFLASLPGRLTDSGVTLMLDVSERHFGRWGPSQDRIAHWLREQGIRLAVDDFGAGHSTFSLLNSWDWDQVKIDASLVSGRDDPQGRLMLRHVAQMLSDLRIPGLAQGVETREQLEHVHGLGIGQALGPHLGEPMSAQDLLADLAHHGVRRPRWRA
ncbi:EAL domain-containing protein [Nocardioides limicola]|uniref:EAL domain-containing protein n=1 Tax=Nocardioides limicola TaxID=2803368 RepID=UPI00193B0431|nr:EAL domain-containing protein [Nocardioides sp. DJM-14]